MGSSRSARCCRSLRRRIIAIVRANSIQGVVRPARTVMTRCAPRFSGSTTRTTQVHGPRKVWKQLRREGFRVARCTVRRLMRAMGLAGAVRDRAWITTTHAGDGGRPTDLVARRCVATRPNELWGSDFTYEATWGGFAYVAFVIDTFAQRIVGWRVSASRRTDFVLDAREQAIAARRGDPANGLVHHSDAGAQAGFKRSSQHVLIGVRVAVR